MTEEESSAFGVDFAWKAHDSISDWTARVDIKASVLLSIDSGLVGLIVALSSGTGPLSGLKNGAVVSYRLGVVALCISTALAIGVIFPQLDRRATRGSWKGQLIYFGYLRRHSPDELRKRLAKLTPEDASQVIARQLVETSKIVWRKHSLFQFAVIALAAAAVCFLVMQVLHH